MINLLSAEDRKNLPSKVCKREVNNYTVYTTCKCYEYWKKRLSEIEKDIVQTKERRTRLYKPLPNDLLHFISVTDLKNLTKEHLVFLKLLKQETLQIYKEAKKVYLDFQKKYSQQLEAETPLWRTVHGKILHRITVLDNSDNGDAFCRVHTTYYVRLNEAHCSFSGFIRNYNIQQIFENEKDDLKNYNFSASYDLNSLMQFYKSKDFKIKIGPIDELPKGTLSVSVFDVVQYKAFKHLPGSLIDTHLTYGEFKRDFEYNSGEHLGRMKRWFADNFKDTLEKQFPGREAYDIVDCGYFKKTFKSWERYYNMWQVNETPEARRAKKSKEKETEA